MILLDWKVNTEFSISDSSCRWSSVLVLGVIDQIRLRADQSFILNNLCSTWEIENGTFNVRMKKKLFQNGILRIFQIKKNIKTVHCSRLLIVDY